MLLAFRDTLDHEVQLSIADPDGHYVVASVKSDGECFTIVNVHLCFKTQDKTHKILSEIGEAIVKMDNERTLWCGDFNCVRDLELDGSHPMRHNVQLE